ncbi:uncharacterized protein tmem174 [Centropristis striata]|uniref:uncharacterized protein tmem174 n=1 Tax=Centropristis striata TaxID=184440 RepID=UPI0027E1C9C0|nr:uncharacterized protein tmem174 [Centropristis striata]
MDQQLFSTNMVVQRPVMETNRADTPAPRHQQSRSMLDSEKTGAVMLFSGVFLALVGVTFTAMGWHFYQANPNFEWTQLLGPILISIGGTFILTSVCKFGIFSCWSCRLLDEEVPAREQTSTGHSFTLSGINQPVLLRNASAMVCFPPQYNFITQEVRQAIDFHAGSSVNAACTPHDAACCRHNSGDSSARCTDSCRRYSFPVPMEVRRDEHAIIRSSRPESAGLRSPGSVLGLCGFHLNVSQELIQTWSDGRINPWDPAFNGLS